MARRRRTKDTSGIGGAVVLIAGVILAFVNATIKFVADNIALFITIGVVIIVMLGTTIIYKSVINKRRKELLGEILSTLRLENIDSILKDYDDYIIVKSRQTLDNYTDLKYLKY